MRILVTHIILAFSIAMTFAQTVNPSVLNKECAKGLKVVNITTLNGELPTYEEAEPPEGAMGNGIKNATKVPGRMEIFSPAGELLYDSKEYLAKTSGMTIKIRGNSSARRDKKPYKIKLQKKADLLSRADNGVVDKNWVLLVDPYLKQFTGFKISEWVGMEFVPASEFVNVIINGIPKGLYLLAESVERNADGRINVGNEGFIAEMDPYWWTEDAYLPSANFHPSYNWTFKYPDIADMTPEYKELAVELLTDFEQRMLQGNYEDVLDVQSMAKFVMVHDIMGTRDAGGVNKYFAVDDVWEENRFRVPCAWDFDVCEYNPESWSAIHAATYSYFFNKVNWSVSMAYVNHWEEIHADIQAKFIDYISTLRSETFKAWNTSIAADAAIWNTEHPSVNITASRLAGWYKPRFEWMSRAVSLLKSEIDGVIQIPQDSISDNLYINLYTITGGNLYQGIKKDMPSVAPGIYIMVFENGITKKIRI